MNQTLCAFPGLVATPVRLLDKDEINVAAMDDLIDATMLARRMTFEEAIVSPDFRIVAKSRLFQVRAAIFKQLDAIVGSI